MAQQVKRGLSATPRHVVLTLGRSGSNWLVGAINQHRDAVNYGEVLGDWTAMSKLKSQLRPNQPWPDFIDRVHTSRSIFACGQMVSAVSHMKKDRPVSWHRSSQVSQIGFKEFATNFERYDMMTYLADRPDVKVVSLTRENMLKRLVSVELLAKTHQVSATNSSRSQSATIELDPDEVLEQLKLYRSEQALQQHLLSGRNPTLEVTYEELFDPDQQSGKMSQIFEFLELDPIETGPGDTKLNSDELEDTIVNYGAVRQVLLGSEFERYLDEQPELIVDDTQWPTIRPNY